MDQMLSSHHRFSVGDHLLGKSIFGLAKSQVLGLTVFPVIGFLMLFSFNGIWGILGLVFVVTLAVLSLLIGWQGWTLDRAVIAGNWYLASVISQRRNRFKFSQFGAPLPSTQSRQVVSYHSRQGLRVSEHYLSKRGRQHLAGKLHHRVFVETFPYFEMDMAQLSLGKKVLFGFELEGDRFLYLDRDAKASNAINFGQFLEVFSAYRDRIDSLCLVYTFTPGNFDTPTSINQESDPELEELVRSSSNSSIRRQLYLLISGSKSTGFAELVSQISVAARDIGVTARGLDQSSLRKVVLFGRPAPDLEKALSMRSHWRHMELGDKLAKLFQVTGLPKGEVNADFLVPFLSSVAGEGLLSFRLKLVDNRYALRKVRAKRSGITADAGVRTLLGFLGRQSENRAIGSLQVQEEELDLGYVMYSVSGTLVLFATTEAELELAANQILLKSEQSGVSLECAYGTQMKCWRDLFGTEGWSNK